MKKRTDNMIDRPFNWRDSSNFAELIIFVVAGCMMSIATDDYSFTMPMYVAYAIVLFRNLLLFRSTKDHFILYKILFYSIIVPDNYIVIAVLFLCTCYSAIVHRYEINNTRSRKGVILAILIIGAFFVINFILSERLWVNALFGVVYLSAFPLAYLFCRLEKNTIKKNYYNMVAFLKGLVVVECVSILSFLVFNFHSAISDIDNDWIVGTFGGMHGNLLLFFFIFSFLMIEKHYKMTKEKKDLVFIVALIIISVLTNSVALTILGLLAYAIGSVLRAKNIKTVLISLGAIVLAGLFFFFVASPQWIQDYMLRFTDISYIKNGIPKIITYEDTFVTIPSKDKKFMVIGNGIGQYSSRAALITTGEYIGAYNRFFEPSVSKYTKQFILERYKRYNVDLAHGTMYSPYSSIITLFGEYGIVGLFGFLAVIFIMLKRSSKEAVVFIVFFFLACFVENYLEFAKVTIPLFIMYYVDQRGMHVR